ncbi:ubl carboxyl-terminal hydrolase 18-like [Thomomys bottae]
MQVKVSLVCLTCTGESSRTSCMLTLPLPLCDMDSKPLKTLEDALRCFFHPRELANKSLEDDAFAPNFDLMRFSIRNSQTEKICHSLHFPQNLDLSHVLLTEQQDPVRPQSREKTGSGAVAQVVEL